MQSCCSLGGTHSAELQARLINHIGNFKFQLRLLRMAPLLGRDNFNVTTQKVAIREPFITKHIATPLKVVGASFPFIAFGAFAIFAILEETA